MDYNKRFWIIKENPNDKESHLFIGSVDTLEDYNNLDILRDDENTIQIIDTKTRLNMRIWQFRQFCYQHRLLINTKDLYEQVFQNIQWAEQALVALAIYIFIQENKGRKDFDYQDTWEGFGSTKNNYMTRARELAGINTDNFLNYLLENFEQEDFQEIFDGKKFDWELISE